jgi:hypothetical protein
LKALTLAALLAWAGAAAAAGEPATRAAWAARLAWPHSLCPARAPRPDSTGVLVQNIDSERRWVVVECQQWAYQGTRIVYLLTPRRATLLLFPQFDAQREGKLRPYRSALLTGTLDFDPDHGQLRVLRLYRGLGDCGQWLRYEAGTAVPLLTELRVRECADQPGSDLPPGQWPLREP